VTAPVTAPRAAQRLVAAELVVAEATALTDDIRQLTLVAPDGGRLPSYPPGSHLGLKWRHGPDRVNAYSLTGNGDSPTAYQVSVLHLPGGSGGSAWAHALRIGAAVQAVAPRSNFAPVARARRHLLIAGGIGITPLLSHARWHASWRNEFALYYVHRPGRAPHLDELADLCGGVGGNGNGRLRVYQDRDALWADLRPALPRQPLGTQLYVCGPRAMIDAVTGAARALHWPDSRISVEPFGAPAEGPRAPFRVTLGKSTTPQPTHINVSAEETLLEALERAGHNVPNMCRQGVCGECRTELRGGRVDHRDLVLSAAEKASNQWLMPCVSRAANDDDDNADADADADELELRL
jgi:dimethylamine monooxygenase subunit B